MTLPQPGPHDPGWGSAGTGVPNADPSSSAQRVPLADPLVARPGSQNDNRRQRPSRGFAGGRVVAVASLLVVGAALAEVALRDRIGQWTTVTLLVVSIVAVLITRRGDRSLPAMMPPLAFLTAVLIAGQGLPPSTTQTPTWWSQQVVMVMEALGPNAFWVVLATVTSVTLAVVRHILDS